MPRLCCGSAEQVNLLCSHLKRKVQLSVFTFQFKSLWLYFLRRQGRRDERDDSEVGYHRNLPAVSVVPALSVVSALSKELISREAHQLSSFNLSLFSFFYYLCFVLCAYKRHKACYCPRVKMLARKSERCNGVKYYKSLSCEQRV